MAVAVVVAVGLLGTATHTLTISNSKSISVTDSLSLRSPTETQTYTLSDTASLTATESYSDSISESTSQSISDTISTTLTSSLSLSLTESYSLTVTDSLSKSWTESLTQTESLSDTYSLSSTDSNSLTESLSQSETYSLSPSISQTGTISLSVSLPTETDTLTDSFTLSLSISTTPSLGTPSQTSTSTVSISATESVSLSETLSLSMSLSLSASKTLSQTVTLSESTSLSLSQSVSMSLSESFSSSLSLTATVRTPTNTPSKTKSLWSVTKSLTPCTPGLLIETSDGVCEPIGVLEFSVRYVGVNLDSLTPDNTGPMRNAICTDTMIAIVKEYDTESCEVLNFQAGSIVARVSVTTTAQKALTSAEQVAQQSSSGTLPVAAVQSVLSAATVDTAFDTAPTVNGVVVAVDQPCTPANCNNRGTATGIRPDCTCACQDGFTGATCTVFPTCAVNTTDPFAACGNTVSAVYVSCERQRCSCMSSTYSETTNQCGDNVASCALRHSCYLEFKSCMAASNLGGTNCVLERRSCCTADAATVGCSECDPISDDEDPLNIFYILIIVGTLALLICICIAFARTRELDRLEKKEARKAARGNDPDNFSDSDRSISPSPRTVVTVVPAQGGVGDLGGARNRGAVTSRKPPSVPPVPVQPQQPAAAPPTAPQVQSKPPSASPRVPYGEAPSGYPELAYQPFSQQRQQPPPPQPPQPPPQPPPVQQQEEQQPPPTRGSNSNTNPISSNQIIAMPVTPQIYHSSGSRNVPNTEGRSDALMTMSSTNMRSDPKKTGSMDTITVVPIAPPRASSPIQSERSQPARGPSEPSASVVARDEENDILNKNDILREYTFKEGTTGKSIRVLGLTEGRGIYYIDGSPRKSFTMVDYNGEVVRFPELQRSVILPLEYNMKEEVVRELKSLFDFCFIEHNLRNGASSPGKLNRISTPGVPVGGSPVVIRTPAGLAPPPPPPPPPAGSAPHIPAIVSHNNGAMWDSNSPRRNNYSSRGPYRIDPFSAGINTLSGIQDPDLASTPPRSRSVSPGDMGPGYHYNY